MSFRAALAASLVLSASAQSVVINEIMFHPLQPAIGPEPVQLEYIELHNRAATNVSLAGWYFGKGVTYTFPPGAVIVAGGYVVVAANATALDERFPGIENVYGNWVGTLGNNGETLELKNAAGATMDSVGYADEGDWAIRQRSPRLSNQRGWIWTSMADGFGRSLERVNPAMTGDAGQNWLSSTVAGGTPGQANSVRATNIAPLILDVVHLPLIPKSTQPVTVLARVLDELPSVPTVALYYRTNVTTSPGPFASTAMFDDGQHGDGAAGDRIYGVVLPAMPNNTLIEFYVQSADQGGNVRTWPGPAYEAADLGGAVLGQVANAAFQVDDTVYPLVEPLYKLIITPAQVTDLGNIFNDTASDAEVNSTVLVQDGTGTECRYLCGVRNRGNGSRSGQPHNHRLNFPGDRPWRGVTALNVNARVVPAQVAGSQLAQRAGAAGANVHFARLLVNNADSIGGRPPNGLYAANEAKDADWSDRIFPDNGGGNVYLVQRNIPPPNFNYRGTDPAQYRNTYIKQSNVSADDWSDLIAMLEVMGENQTATFTMARARGVIDVEQWLLHLAVMSMFGNNESGINTGNNDDYYLYSGSVDRRFNLIYHDLDTVLGLGGAKSATDGIFGATQCCISGDSQGIGQAMNFFMHHPEVEPLYYRALQDLIDGPFSEGQFNSAVDTLFSAYPALAGNAATIKSYMTTRRTHVQGLIDGLVPPSSKPPLAVVSGAPRAVTPFNRINLTVGGDGVTHYRYRMNNGAYGQETSITMPIILSSLPDGSSNVLRVIAKNANNVWQSTNTPTVVSWVVNTSWPGVRLNEVLARNDTAVPHEGGFPDIVELFNEGTATVNLAGFRMTDDLTDSNKFVFPAGSQLAPGGYLLLYADNASTSGLHLGFGLGQHGDDLYLLQPVSGGGAVVDSVRFGLQVSDRSIGRYGLSGDWLLSVPTPAATNRTQALGNPMALRINEWFAASEPPLTEDYVEIYNPDVLPVAVGDHYLSDQPLGRPAQHRIASLSFLAAGEFFPFIADGQAGAGAEHVNFRLSSDVGSIALYTPNLREIDYIIYTPQRTGVSMGRCPDGGVTNVAMTLRTPGAPNYCPVPPPPAPPPVLQNLLPVSATWRYLQSSAQTNNLDGVNWPSPGYDDSSWPTGQGVFGVGSAVPETVRTPLTASSANITYYFRTTFNVPAGFSPTSLQFSNVIDDGAVFYLNGREVARYNMPAGPILNQTPPAQGLGGPPSWTGPIVVATTNVVPGINTLAIEVHNASPYGDVFMGTRLDGVTVTNIPAAGSLTINEVMADNRGGVMVAGRTPDWVEFYNATGASIDMGGMSLSDRLDDPAARWVFPAGSIVPAGGYLVIYADADVPASANNTGFGLNAKGGAVYLFKAAPRANEIFDFVEYGIQTADHSIARIPSGSATWALALPTPGLTNAGAEMGSASGLRINEWMADPSSGDDWFEIYNSGSRPVALDGLGLTDTFGDPNPTRVAALSFVGVGSNAFVRFIADNPATPSGPDHVNFKLSKEKDSIYLLAAADGAPLDAVTFVAQALDVSEGRLPDGGATVVSFPLSPTPEESNFLPMTNVVVNEVLSHTDLPLEDAIELRNLTAQPVNISGWWLSDSKDVLRKFQVPADTILPAGGFKVFYEQQFNNDLNAVAFSLSSADGDQVYLSETTGSGTLTGYRAIARFGPSANGVSFGRYVNSVGAVDYPALSALTFGTSVTAGSPPDQITLFRTGLGAANSYPKVGPVIISEIMYHPPDAGTNDNVVDEFIELRNIGSELVPLFDPGYTTNGWRLRDAVSFQFTSGHSIPPGGHLLVVSFDPVTNAAALATFRAHYGTNLVLVGPYAGKLDNSSESVELVRPDTPQMAPSPNAGQVPYILVEKVVYADHNPWPTNADGHGFSLQRVSATGYANEPTNWTAAAPSPGPPGISGDADFDGMPDDWEQANGLNPNDPSDALQDADGDGLKNRDEYFAGTNPRDAGSSLRLGAARVGGNVELKFNAVAARTYTVLYSETLPGGWQRLIDIPAQAANAQVTVSDNAVTYRGQRFYRVVTPAAP